MDLRERHGARAASILSPDKKGYRANAWVDAYTSWVIQNLVGVKGRNPTDVASTLLREWVTANKDDLEKMGLWPPQVRAGQAVIIPPGA